MIDTRTLIARIGLSGLAIAVLCLLLAVQTVRIEGFKLWPLSVDGLKTERDDAIAAAASCETRHAVTRQSVETLQATISELNAAADHRAEQYAEAWALWEKEKKRLERDAAKSDKRIARLNEIASRQMEGNCAIPDDLRDALEGL